MFYKKTDDVCAEVYDGVCETPECPFHAGKKCNTGFSLKAFVESNYFWAFVVWVAIVVFFGSVIIATAQTAQYDFYMAEEVKKLAASNEYRVDIFESPEGMGCIVTYKHELGEDKIYFSEGGEKYSYTESLRYSTVSSSTKSDSGELVGDEPGQLLGI